MDRSTAADTSTTRTWAAPTDIVASQVPALRSELKTIMTEGVADLVMDLSQTRMLDSTGIGLIVAAHNSLGKYGGSIRLIHVSEEISSLLRSMRLHQYFSISTGNGENPQ